MRVLRSAVRLGSRVRHTETGSSGRFTEAFNKTDSHFTGRSGQAQSRTFSARHAEANNRNVNQCHRSCSAITLATNSGNLGCTSLAQLQLLRRCLGLLAMGEDGV